MIGFQGGGSGQHVGPELDALAADPREHDLALHGPTLIWIGGGGKAFPGLGAARAQPRPSRSTSRVRCT